jgi:hypothetical protein
VNAKRPIPSKSKIMKIIISIILAAMLVGCNTKEKARLELKVDSLNNVLAESTRRDMAMNEVGIMLDSIDLSRQVLRVRIVEGISYADYVDRLREINTDIKDTQLRIASLERDLKASSSASSSTIRRLKADAALKLQEIVALQMDVIELREQNGNLKASLSQKDSTISSQKEMIQLKSGEVATLQGLVEDINEQNRIKVAGLYFAQASALETAADRTKFAPRKKKETRREALELYKLSYSLGNENARVKIEELEKKIG